MVLNAAVQMLREADELKQKILKFKSGTSMLQESSLWVLQQQLQQVYQKVLILDLDYALDKKVEQDLWNIGFKQQIEALQAISKDRKNPLRSEGQAMLSWVLHAAAGFYLCLLHQICSTFKLDLPFRRRASLLGWVEGWSANETTGESRAPPPAAARYICQHCLVHLGDLARYRHHMRVAHSFYKHALVVSAHSGQPYNQLALVSWRRGRRLGALYWHVRSLLVRAPFPPAPANLQRTLAAAAAAADPVPTRRDKDLPVLPGLRAGTGAPAAPRTVARLDAHSYVSELIRAIHLIHTDEDLDTASSIVDNLNSSLTALIATDSFESMTLIKMACVLIWLVHSTTEGLEDISALSESEARAAQLSESLAAGALLALLLPAYTAERMERSLPTLSVWLSWLVGRGGGFARGAAWSSRPQLWPACAHALNRLAQHHHPDLDKYASVPLPEDEELHGFLPLEQAHASLRFANHAVWDTYGGRVPQQGDLPHLSPSDTAALCLTNEPELEARVRAHRLVLLGQRLADLSGGNLSYTEEEGSVKFSSCGSGAEQLSLALAALAAAGEGERGAGDAEADSDDEPPPPQPPLVISEADFLREKRVGILKPQGSLERAREERALVTTQEEQEVDIFEESKGEDKKESRKPRVNIAMAAIMRKQEETNKQVKFVTPPPTPDSMGAVDSKDDKPKVIQPKPIKSLANLPIGRKTGGILALKDKSAGYPHLVNTDPEPKKEDDKQKDPKPAPPPNQSYQHKRELPPSPNWSANVATQSYDPRMSFQKLYGNRNPGLSYSPNFNNQGLRLPVVNPKEIDVRTAALQKQNSRQELFQEGQKFGNFNYQISGDKKNFLNDLPPRFANQYRYWQNGPRDNQNDNKFRDDNFKTDDASFTNQQQQRLNWMNTPQMDNYQQPNPWWTPDNPPPNFNANFSSMNVQPNFYSPHLTSNLPYQTMPYNQMPTTQEKPQNLIAPPNYLSTIGQPQLHTLQNLVTSPNFNSSLSNFGTYAPPVGYDSSMYPQFNSKLGYQPMQMKMLDKTRYPAKDLMDMSSLNFGSNILDTQQRNMTMNLNERPSDGGVNLDQIRNPDGGSGEAGNTYSLFSAADTAWSPAHSPQQSLWSGPGPSPLERLLEQQKQMNQPPAPQ